MVAPIVYGGYVLGGALLRYAARRGAQSLVRRQAQRRRCRNGRCDDDPPDEWHHEFPQQFRVRFRNRNIDIDAPQNGRVIPRPQHRLIHSAGYNPEWREFLFEENPTASRADMEEKRDEMVITYALIQYRRPRGRYPRK